MQRQISRSLNVLKTPLTGINLIEASAGTGKTRAITDLYVRCLLETERQVREILVVTFTVAATAELQDRIRQRLLDVHHAFSGGTSADLFCQQLVTAYSNRHQALQTLDNALWGFDEAAIYTIHGFCERVLTDGAFESGMPFEHVLLPDERELLQDIVDDFWRRRLYDASPLFVRHLLDVRYSPEQFLTLIRPHVGKPYLTVVPPESAASLCGGRTLVQVEAAFAEAYQKVRVLWQTAATEVESLLRTSQSLNRNMYRLGSIPGWLDWMDAYLALEAPNPQLCDPFERFTDSRLARAVKKGAQPLQHPFFTACDVLAVAHEPLQSFYNRQLHALKVDLFTYCQRELGIRKRRRQALSYDDLLIHLDRALASHHGHVLAESIRRRYPVALIDEFQDTDPVQYHIFRQIYHGTSAPVFIVGDPKQAIYSFRGADIFTYLQACRDTTDRYTLDINRRSDPDLIQAVNTLFASARQPFLFDDITFRPVQPGPPRSERFTESTHQVSQLCVWFLEGDAEGQRVTKQDAEALAARATAVEIARLLNLGACGEAQIGQRPLEGGDMAVLVRTHHQGRRVRDALLRLRVASVQLGQDNIFDSSEALELERVLRAVAQPTSASLVRGALATVMLGATGEHLAELLDDEQAWEDRVTAFQEYHSLWQEAGFAPMWRTLTAQEQVARRLLGFRDGERRLTNLLHVAELLQAAADRQRTGMAGLLRWLAERRQTHAAEDDEAQLRLESDEHLVKIVTIHKSKGLEYPIVFCPFLWSGRLRSLTSNPLSFHQPDDDYHAVLDLGSPRLEDNRVHACREEAAENLRLLYVALTRAQHCCYLVWGAIRDLGASPLAWLFHQPEGVDGTLTREVVEAHVKGRSAAELRSDVERCAALAKGGIRIEPLPTDVDAPYQPPSHAAPAFAARRFPGPIRVQWRMTSFTALAADSGAELPDYDAIARPFVLEPHAPEPRTIFTFPRGVRAGRCFHAMFERLDFTQQERCGLDGLVAQCLAEHGFDAIWLPVVADMVERVVTAPLNASGGLSLHRIPPTRRLTELEFYYPVAGLTCEGLQRVLSAHGFAVARHRAEMERLSFAPTRGYMKGFIDLVFEAEGRYYLVDYKSHWLGSTAEAYRVEALHQVMAHELYDLQYLIYTLAVHRYLQLRLPGYDYDTHFGGVWYLFVRGVDPIFPTCGIFHDRPARHLIEALDTYLTTGSPGS